MGFLKRFLKTTYRDNTAGKSRSSFESLSEDQLETHLNIAKYGDFMLTDAIRPSYDLEVVPQAGYRHDVYTDKESGIKIPVLMASASREVLFDLFIDLLDPLGHEVDVVLETSHDGGHNQHQDLYREHMDLPVLKSTLYDYEDLLLNDGCAGIAVLNPLIPLEVQFDEHKLLIMYGQGIDQFESILDEYGIPHDPELKFITEAEHVHSSSDEAIEELDQLKYRLGIDFE
ncbi:hypothetical protein [Gimesia chilikensis]|uniref:Uncharacterized protein n=1 Tax=Gimesia chilikensis TaxID=2605989 RepID=A0A517PR65_9PLAN|nr:hypothetical protein [Gimesia chilikensis]MBN68089.1 hypothetical protein [Gimesia sp.]MCR9233290.1 hypothetical protein [bacterium]KAA0132937.1 hypothetical protein FYZ48_24115 [Gimesia chilikensis]QDT21862.1 hypothetical protein HG66A1_36660 [Gimesia chilikensis]QDT85882.1 hypothetical protein MalM14_35530 [Gimesia chilikensis]